jgi:hypothetical protein
MNFTQEYTYSRHYGTSQVPTHLLDSDLDTEAPAVLQAAEGATTNEIAA